MITIVVGAQYGGEGKGKVAAYLAFAERPDCACRCGGPNSSHTVVWRNTIHRLRMMPTASVVHTDMDVLFGAGTLIHVPTLFREIGVIGFTGRIMIDPNAGIITEDIIEEQRADPRYATLGSTLTGTGYASAKRSLRSLPLAKDCPNLAHLLGDVAGYLQNLIARRGSVLIEGHQGYGLSNYHGDYPFTSSRDSTASSMLAELGLGPIQTDMKIVLATKLFPTRNHAGALHEELSRAQINNLGITEEGGGAWDLPNRPRRVGLLDLTIVKRAIFANSATEIALTGVDYLYKTDASRTDIDGASRELYTLVKEIETVAEIPVRYVSTGPDTEAMIDMIVERNARTNIREFRRAS